MSLIAPSHRGREYHLASNRTLAEPLPRLTPTPDLTPADASSLPRHEVIVVGAGPAGIFLTLLLARYGLPSTRSQPSLLCIDKASHATKTGHADGVMVRTTEVLRTLDLEHEIMRHASHIREGGTWAYDSATDGLVRSEPIITLNFGDYRYGEGFECIHQGRMERVLEDDLKMYADNGVERETKCVDVKIDEEGDPEFPVLATLECRGEMRRVRTKYLVGADGGRSNVRASLGIKMEGETSDDVFGVVDLVADSDYPDLRRQSFIGTKDEKIMLHIPREKKHDGTWLTRMYVPFAKARNDAAAVNGVNGTGSEAKHRENRNNITLDMIMERVRENLRPYRFEVKEGTEVEWWTVYQVGQRVASELAVRDSKKHSRVFLVGDACHTHSPKLGQGMNVSMMDSFNLSWKLAHVMFGLTGDGTKLLDTYEEERGENAKNLVNMDKWWYERSYEAGVQNISRGEVRAQMLDFVAGVGTEYQAKTMVTDTRVTGDDAKSILRYSAGAWREGRRMETTVVKRFADGNNLHLHDEIGADSRYSVVVWTGKDLLKPDSASRLVLEALCKETLPSLPDGLVKVFIVHSLEHHSFEWTDLPGSVKDISEMRLYRAEEAQYEKYGVDIQNGRICVVRPDMHIGTITEVTEGPDGLEKVTSYLRRCLKSSKTFAVKQ